MVPPLALIPVVIIYIGIGQSAKIIVIVVAVFLTVVIAAFQGVSKAESVSGPSRSNIGTASTASLPVSYLARSGALYISGPPSWPRRRVGRRSSQQNLLRHSPGWAIWSKCPVRTSISRADIWLLF